MFRKDHVLEVSLHRGKDEARNGVYSMPKATIQRNPIEIRIHSRVPEWIRVR